MSDVSLRSSARRFAASGSVDDEARALRERVRTGRLAVERLRVCAYLGHEAAWRTIGDPLAATFSLVRLRLGGDRSGWKRHVRATPTRPLVLALVKTIESARSVASWRTPVQPVSSHVVGEALSSLRGWAVEEGAARSALHEADALVRSARQPSSHLTHAARCALSVALDAGHRKHQHALAALLAASAASRRWTPLEQTFTHTLVDALLA